MSEICTLTIDDPAYPVLLREIPDAPERLFVRGNSEALSHPCPLAIVGTRRSSSYGETMTRRLAGDLAKAGAAIVSGLALGVDTTAHKATLETNGVTVAVLGSGISDADIYPASNLSLARKIIESDGVLISEYEAETPSYPSNFLARNRIIAALCLGTLVVEAPAKSGALATARRALEYNRDVYAVPGEATSYRSEGTNKLIKQGALCVTSANDILDTIDATYLTPATKHGTEQALSPTEQIILQTVRDTKAGAHLDTIVAATGLDATVVASAIIALVLEGILQEREPNTYIMGE